MEKNKRRQFLKNTSLSLLSASILPTIVKAQKISLIILKRIQLFFVIIQLKTISLWTRSFLYHASNILNNQLANVNEPGIKIIISGQVFNLECSEVIPNTEIDICLRMIQDFMIIQDII